VIQPLRRRQVRLVLALGALALVAITAGLLAWSHRESAVAALRETPAPAVAAPDGER